MKPQFEFARPVGFGALAFAALLAASGTTSPAAMVSCCAHYLVNAAGIAYVGNKLLQATRAHAPCVT